MSDRARRAISDGHEVIEQWRGPDATEQSTAPLDDLINEESAQTVDALEEQERERVAALAAAFAAAPLRVANASRRTLGTVVTPLVVGGAQTISGALRSTGLMAGTGLAALRHRRASGQQSPGSRSAVRRRARRLAAAATLALAVAAPAAASPAPWSALVGFSVNGTGVHVTSAKLPGHLASATALGPLPTVLPERGLVVTPGLAGLPVGLNSGADPAAAGLPLGGGDRSIPSTVLLAYQQASDRLASTSPGCRLQWTLLAGIGKVESNHARGWSGAAALTADGTATPAILGPVLDGSTPGTAVLPDTDGGRLDGNAAFDRAVGPMQFVPGTWKLVGQDGNGDGKLDPNNVFDAALSTGTYLCSSGRDLGVPAAQLAAVLAYNPSSEYARAVLAWASAYSTGAPVDLSMPIAAFAGPPAISGGQIGRFAVPVSGSPSLLFVDPNSRGLPAVQATQGDIPLILPPAVKPPNTGSGQGPGAVGGSATPPGTTTPPDPQRAPLTAARGPLIEERVVDPKTGRAGLRFTLSLSASKTSFARVSLRLADSGDLRVTGVGTVVSLTTGPNQVTLGVDGGFLGDSGVNGPYRVTTSYLETDRDGAAAAGASTKALGTETRSKTYSAADFAYYVPSIARIDARVTEFAVRGLVTSAAQDRLHALLREQNPNLDLVRLELTRDELDGSIGVEAFARLDSLVQRHQNPPVGTKATPESAPAAAPPGRDPELAAGRSVR